jgi:formylglycine-generating enzyme required for sulfatase activity
MPLDPLHLVGTLVAEKYRIEEVVAEGGFSIVYRATHLLWKRPVAIKVWNALRDLPADQQERLLQGFLQEGVILGELSERSAAICQARDTGTLVNPRGERLPYMVLEWLDGEAFDVVLQRERNAGLLPRTLHDALELLEPAMKALALAHASGIAHRDVKPANLFVVGDPRSDSCRIKVLDFGIAKVAGEAQKIVGFTKTSHQPTPFTPVYAAPEQFSRTFGPTGPWTDVYGIALVLVETVTGRDAVSAEDPHTAYDLACDPSRRPTPRAFGVELGDPVERVFERALAVRPSDRYAAADDFLDALRIAIDLPPVSKLVDSDRLEALRSSTSAHSSSTPLAGTMPLTPDLASPRTRGVLFYGVVGAAAMAAIVALGFGGRLFLSRGDAEGPREGVAVIGAAAQPTPPPAPPPEPTCPAGMVLIPGGHFFMGSDDDLPMEKPAHRVLLQPYCMDVFEVKTSDYKACSDRGDCKRAGTTNEWTKITAKDRASFDPLCNVSDLEAKGNHPINCVDWSMADNYCRVNDKRLPSEAEWEFAARGPDGRRYPWGDEAPNQELLNACGKECVAWGAAHHVDETAMYEGDDGFPTTAPVGSFPKGASRYGVQDVVGNVWEWAADWYEPYAADEQSDPHGPPKGDGRVIRGGSWNGAYESWSFRPSAITTSQPNGATESAFAALAPSKARPKPRRSKRCRLALPLAERVFACKVRLPASPVRELWGKNPESFRFGSKSKYRVWTVVTAPSPLFWRGSTSEEPLE